MATHPVPGTVFRAAATALAIATCFAVGSLLAGRSWSSVLPGALLLLLVDLFVFSVVFVRRVERR